jgi:CMP-N-acetylneuraminic acid synthetase
MTERAKPLCIIPARGGSKRLPRKNIVLLAGKPLLGWAIEAAQESRVFDQICVTSEDSEIQAVAREYGTDVIHQRAPGLATDTAQVKQVCVDVLRDLEAQDIFYKAFGVLLTTTPLRRPEDLRIAWNQFQGSDADVLMSVTRYDQPPQRALAIRNGFLTPFFGHKYYGPRQELEPLYRHDGTVIYANVQPFLRTGEFYQERLLPFEIDSRHAVDVDQPLDLAWIEFLIRQAHSEGEAAS